MDIQDIRPEMMVHAKGSKGREMQEQGTFTWGAGATPTPEIKKMLG